MKILSPHTKLNSIKRPWGYYTNLVNGNNTLTKLICVYPKQRLSLQSHNHRSEHWTVIKGKGIIVLNEDKYVANLGQSFDIPLKAKHSLQNPYDEDLEVIEVQIGDHLSEDDIVRYEDIYGRV